MPLIKQRTSFFVFTEDESPTGYVNSIKQDSQVIKLPSNSKNPISRQEKLEINVDGLKDKYRVLFDKIGIFHIQFDDGKHRQLSNQFESMFLNNDNLVEPGLVINVAPQEAKSINEYEELSQDVIDLMFAFMNLGKDVHKDQLLPVFYKEWFRTSLFDDKLDPIDMVLHLWKYVTKDSVSFPIDDIEGLSGFEFVYDKRGTSSEEGEKFGPSLILYFKEITKPVTLSKYDTKAKNVLNEVGIFVKSSKAIEETNYVYSGYLFEMSDSTEILLSQTMVQLVPEIRPMFYHTISHEIVEPYGIHPIYKVKFDTIDAKLKESLKLEPALYHDYKANKKQIESMGGNVKNDNYDLYCDLKMTMDLPKSVFIDQYQLQSNREYREFFPNFRLFEEPDLELPSYKIDKFGISVKFDLNSTKIVENDYEFEIPLHLRYLEPVHGGRKEVLIPRANIYWECQYEKLLSLDNEEQLSRDEEIEDFNRIDSISTIERQMKESLFHETRLNELSLVDLKNEDTVPFLFSFKSVSSNNDNKDDNYIRIKIPVGDYEQDGYLVEMMTLIVVFFSSLWILKRLFL